MGYYGSMCPPFIPLCRLIQICVITVPLPIPRLCILGTEKLAGFRRKQTMHINKFEIVNTTYTHRA